MSFGYQFIYEKLDLPVFHPQDTVKVDPAARKVTKANGLKVIPLSALPKSNSVVEHLLFAVKHEGINLQILTETLRRISTEQMCNIVKTSPTGEHVRRLALLWEFSNGKTLDFPAVRAAYKPLFDPLMYVTGQPRPNRKWKILVNGLGPLEYCPVVRRTREIEQALANGMQASLQEYVNRHDRQSIARVVNWAFLSETESTFSIERETPSGSRAERFRALLEETADMPVLSEDLLCECQRKTISNPFSKAFSMRSDQNWLRRAGSVGSSSISYVPPSPEDLADLMSGFLSMVNGFCCDSSPANPVIAAAVTSFGFVYLHPFRDGNGRLSRFLIHYVLSHSGLVPNGMIFPVSVAMQEHEDEYLEALEEFSRKARAWWEVTLVDEGSCLFKFNASPAIYRYWDATVQAEFVARMAKESLDKHLFLESEYLERHDAIVRHVSEQFDVPQRILCTLTSAALRHNGKISNNLRKKFVYDVESAAFDEIEKASSEILGADSARQRGSS